MLPCCKWGISVVWDFQFVFCDDTRRKWWEIRNPRDLWSSKDPLCDGKKTDYCWVLYLLKQRVRCGKCRGFLSPRLKFNSACRSKGKCVVDVEFETEFFADQGELKFIRVVSVRKILLLVWVLFPKSWGGVKHDLKAFPHLWHICEYFKSCHDYFSTLFSSESNKTKTKKKDKLWSRVSQLGWQNRFFSPCTLGCIWELFIRFTWNNYF